MLDLTWSVEGEVVDLDYCSQRVTINYRGFQIRIFATEKQIDKIMLKRLGYKSMKFILGKDGKLISFEGTVRQPR